MRKTHVVVLFLLAMSMAIASPALAEDFFWGLASGSGFVDDTANWTGGVVPGDDPEGETFDDEVYVNTAGTMLIDSSHQFAQFSGGTGYLSRFFVGDTSGAGYVEQSGGRVDVLSRICVGHGAAAGTTSTYSFSYGELVQRNNGQSMYIGGNGSRGELYVTGGTSDEDQTELKLDSNSTFRVGRAKEIAGGSGFCKMEDYAYGKLGRAFEIGWTNSTMTDGVDGTLWLSGHTYARIYDKDNGQKSYIGRGYEATGLLTIDGNAEANFQLSAVLNVGSVGSENHEAHGTIDLSENGSLTVNRQCNVGADSYSTGIVNVYGSAIFDAGSRFFLGLKEENAYGELNVYTGASGTGGIVNIGQDLTLGRDQSEGLLNISDEGQVNVTSSVRLGSGGGTATINLDGGILACTEIYTEDGNSEKGTTIATINFNGGVLQATADSVDFIHPAAGYTYTDQRLNVKAGGAIIDTDVEIEEVTEAHDVTILQPFLEDVVSTGGGLTKIGTGTLTLGGANTYTGDTTVEAGTLSITGNTMLSDTGDLSLAAGAVMDLNFTGLSETVSGLYLDGVAQALGTWGASGSGATHVDDTYFTGTGTIFVGSTQIPGDTNGDLIVDETDATMVASNWGSPTTEGPSAGDFNNDGMVDATDASIMAGNWGDHRGGSVEGAVPEPSTLAMILACLGSLAFLRRK